MIVNKIEDRMYFKSKLFSKSKNITHFFTTKNGGCSKGKIDGLNLGLRVGDDIESVKQNYIKISRDFEIPYERITSAKQIHSSKITVIREEQCGYGVSRPEKILETDGLVTNCRQLPIMVFYADCVPILLSDEDAGVVAAVHSGWRGTVAQIAKNAIEIMKNQFDANPQNIKAVIGPSICKDCFETGEVVAEKFDADLVSPFKEDKFKVDLWEANKRILIKSGLINTNIDVLGVCTMCNSDSLYSYRKHGQNTGRMGAVIMLK
jgi:YfiH family protein